MGACSSSSTASSPPADGGSSAKPDAATSAVDGAVPPPPPGDDASVDAPAATDAKVSASGAWSMGYYAGYLTSSYPVANIDWAGLTHIAVAFYLPHADGSIDDTLFMDETSGPALAQSIVDAAHAHGVKAIASIGGAGSGMALEGATSSGSMATFVKNLVLILTTYGYDGLDIDWEPLLTTDQASAIAIAKAVRAAHPGALMTMPVGYENANLPDDLSGYPAIAGVYDQINVMTYGMSGAYSGWKSWHSGPLYFTDKATPVSVDNSVGLYLGAGVPAAKLGFGIGFYGLCYSSPVMAPDQALAGSTIVADDNSMSYTNIMGTYYSASAHQWDTEAHVPYLTFAAPQGPNGCTYVSYDDAQSIADKATYLKSKGLGGVIVWTINEGLIGTGSPLLDAIHDDILE